MSIKILDVGQGDSILIRTPGGHKILVDGGPSDKVLDYLGSELPFYDKDLDLVVLTHPDKDHLTGLIEVVKRYNVKHLWTSYGENNTAEFEAWKSVVSSEILNVQVVWSGDKMTFSDGLTLEVVSPKEQASFSDTNSSSIVILIDYKEFEGILTGDADNQVQPYTSNLGEVEFLQIPHHASKLALDEAYTKLLSPAVSVISVGSRNSYGHPAKNTLEFLQSIGSKIFRTDQNGTIEIVSDGINWYTTSER